MPKPTPEEKILNEDFWAWRAKDPGRIELPGAGAMTPKEFDAGFDEQVERWRREWHRKQKAASSTPVSTANIGEIPKRTPTQQKAAANPYVIQQKAATRNARNAGNIVRRGPRDLKVPGQLAAAVKEIGPGEPLKPWDMWFGLNEKATKEWAGLWEKGGAAEYKLLRFKKPPANSGDLQALKELLEEYRNALHGPLELEVAGVGALEQPEWRGKEIEQAARHRETLRRRPTPLAREGNKLTPNKEMTRRLKNLSHTLSLPGVKEKLLASVGAEMRPFAGPSPALMDIGRMERAAAMEGLIDTVQKEVGALLDPNAGGGPALSKGQAAKPVSLFEAMMETKKGKLAPTDYHSGTSTMGQNRGVSSRNWPSWFREGETRAAKNFLGRSKGSGSVLSKGLKGGGKIAPILLLAGLLGSMGLGD